MTNTILDEHGRIVGRSWTCSCSETVDSWGTMGRDVECHSCSRIFNCFGQELAPMSQWEES